MPKDVQWARWVFIALVLVTWPHFSDPPLRNVVGEDPCVVTTPSMPVGPFSFFLFCSLLLRLFVYAFVIFSGVYLGVVLFVFCVVKFCIRRLLSDFYVRTWTFQTKRTILLLLLLGQTAHIMEFSPRASSVFRRQPTPTLFRYFASITRPSQSMLRNLEYSNVRRMLLVSCGSVEM